MTHLTHDELSSLIEAYESELRKLKFRVDLTTKTLEELYQLLRAKSESRIAPLEQEQESPAAVTVSEPVAPASRAVEKPKEEKPKEEKIEPAVKSRKKRSKIDASTPPPGIETGKGYRLSEWDNVVLHAVYNAGYPLTYNEMYEESMKYTTQNNLGFTESQVKGKINRTLQKLCVRREILLKHPYDGRGYTYGLYFWNSETGELAAEFQRPTE